MKSFKPPIMLFFGDGRKSFSVQWQLLDTFSKLYCLLYIWSLHLLSLKKWVKYERWSDFQSIKITVNWRTIWLKIGKSQKVKRTKGQVVTLAVFLERHPGVLPDHAEPRAEDAVRLLPHYHRVACNQYFVLYHYHIISCVMSSSYQLSFYNVQNIFSSFHQQ